MNPIDIVGGGLSGLALGIALRRAEVPVTVWEAGTYPRHRVCGEFICGVSSDTLSDLGILDLFSDAAILRSAAWHHQNEEVFDLALPITATGLSRFAIDLRLADRFRELGGDLREGERFREKEIRSPGLVWACGRVPAKSHLLGLKLHVLDFELKTDLEMHFGPGGYAGLSAVEDGRVNICALFRKRNEVKADRERLFLAYLEACGMTDLVGRIERATIDHDSHCAVSSVPAGYCRSVSDDEPCAVGDHFGMMGPFTGNGISMAFESAALSVAPLSAYARGVNSWPDTIVNVLKVQQDAFQSRLRLSHGLHEAVLNPLGLSGLAVLGKLRVLPFDYLFRQLR